MASGGFFRVPNRLLIEGCARPVALAVYARLAATPRVWTERGALQPFEARASLNELARATGATRKQVRGGVEWLIREGFIVRLDTSPQTAAVFRIVTEGAQLDRGASDDTPTTSANGPDSQGHSSREKGTDKGTVGAQHKRNNANDLRRSLNREGHSSGHRS